MTITAAITQLPKKAKSLTGKDKELFERFYNVKQATGTLIPPKEMIPWIRKTFGSLAAVKKQHIIDVRNKISFEAALFNELRTKRPRVTNSIHDARDDAIAKSKGGLFCTPEKGTPQDSWGRVKKHGITTAANIAMYDAPHGLIIFNKHDPLALTKQDFRDHFSVAKTWFKKSSTKEAQYPFLMWNCLWKSASSIIHGHFQALLAKHQHYAKADYYNELAKVYEEAYGTDYWTDLWKAHKTVGLAKRKNGLKVLVHLTPVKEKEIIILSDAFDDRLADACHHVVQVYQKLGVDSFNMGITLPPLQQNEEWHLPVIARFVDRGSLKTKTADIGAMELFAGSNVIDTDPYHVIEKL